MTRQQPPAEVPSWLGRFGAGLFGRQLEALFTTPPPPLPLPPPPPPRVQVHRVQPAELDTDRLADYALDSPREGQTSSHYALDISGWVLGQRSRATHVEVLAGSRVIRQTEVWLPRTDLAREYWGAAGAERAGFHASVSVLGLHRYFRLNVRAVLADGVRVPLGFIEAQHEPLSASYEPRRQPILVTGLARSGTTWLVRLLAEHPDIVVHPLYPFESSPALYLLHALRVFTTPSNPIRPAVFVPMRHTTQSVHPLPIFCHDEEPTLHAWLREGYVERFAEQTLQTIDALYDQIAEGCQRPGAGWFCEKTVGQQHLAGMLTEAYPEAKEIFLVRDFRDMVCSWLSFFGKQEGTRAHADFERVAAEDLPQQIRLLLADWEERRDRAYLLRYEDLVARPVETLERLFAYLGFEMSREAVEALHRQASGDSGIRAEHRTFTDAKATVGRWHDELDAEQMTRCNAVCEEALATFGYERAA